MTTKISTDNIQSATLATIGSGPKVQQIQVCDANYAALDDTAVALTGGYIKITGSGFKSGATVTVNRSQATSVTFVSSTELLAQVPAQTAGTYVVYVVNTDGSVALRVNGITFSSEPTWVTDSTLPEKGAGEAISIQLSAMQASTYTLAANSVLPPGLTLSSTGLLSGAVVTEQQTLYNFSILATDTELQDSPRTFSVNISVGDSYFNSTTLLLSGSANTFVRDASTNNFAVTVVGDTKPTNFNPYLTGWSNYFDGTGDYITAPANAALQLTSDFTVEAWIYPTTINTFNMVFGSDNGQSSDYLTIRASTIELAVSNTAYPAWTQTFVANRWYHIAVTRQSNTIRAFVDGVALTLSSGSATNSSQYFQSGAGVSIGRYGYTTTPHHFTGYISNARIVKGTAVYTTNFTPTTQPLTLITGTSLLTCADNRIVDTSINNLAITKNGDVSVRSFSPFVEPASSSGSGYFDGTGDYLTVPSNAAFQLGSGDFTIECWVYINAVGASGTWFAGPWGVSGGTNRSWDFAYYPAGGGIVFGYSTNGTNGTLITGNTTLSLNTWYHVAAVRSGDTLTIYQNGILLGSASMAGITINPGTNSLWVGANPEDSGGSSFALNGYISNLRVVKGTALYTANFTPPTTPLTAVSGTSLLTLQSNTPVANNTFLDASSSNSLVTSAGNATQGTFSPYSPSGWSNYFDGSSTYLTLPSSSSAYNFSSGVNFTVEAWVYPTLLAGSSWGIVDARVSGATNAAWIVHLVPVSGTYRLQFFNAGGNTGTAVIPLNAWTHIAVVRNGTALQTYVNGVLDLNSASYGSGSISPGTTAPRIGPTKDASGTSYTTVGNISNLRIVNGTAVYTSNFTPSTQPLTAIAGTSLLTCADNRFIDESANNFAITRAGDTRVTNLSPFKAVAQTPVTYSSYFVTGAPGSYLSVPTNTQLDFGSSDFTVECWIYPVAFDSTDGAFMGVGPQSGSASWLVRGFSTGVVTFVAWTAATTASISFSTPASSITFNAWNHIAVTRSGSSFTIWINGVSKATTTSSSAIVNTGRSAFINYGYSNSAGRTQTAFISNVRWVKGTAVYTANFAPPTQPLTAITNTSLLTCQSATFTDNSTNKFAITAVGSAQPTTVNPFGSTFVKSTGYTAAEYSGSMYFDGTGDYLSGTILAAGTGDLTYEAWVYVTDRSLARLVLTTRSGNTSDGFQVLVDSGGEVRLGYAGSNFINTAAGSITVGQWYHIAATRKSGTITLWINGVSVATTANSTNFTSTVYRAGLGAENQAPMLGYISDVRMVHGQSLYTSNFVPPLAPVLPVANTVLLLNGTSAAITDATTKTIVETVGDVKISTAVSKFGGSSMSFDGTGDVLIAPSNRVYAFGTGNFTIEAWIYRTDTGVQRAIVDTRGGNAVGALLYITVNNKLNIFDSTSVWITSTNTVPANQWVHVVAARSNAVTKLFINGIEEASVADSRTYTNGAGGLYIGRQFGSTSNDFLGYMQDVRVTTGTARYTANFTPPTSALLKK